MSRLPPLEAPPLPPSPMSEEPQASPNVPLPWSVVPALAGLGVVMGAATLLPQTPWPPPRTQTLVSLLASGAVCALLGLALAFADRRLPGLPRPLRWALGMGAVGALPIWLGVAVAQGTPIGQLLARIPALALFVGFGAVHGSAKGLAVGWAAAPAGGRYGRMAMAGAVIGILLCALSIGVVVVQMGAAQVSAFPWRNFATSQGLSLVGTVLQALVLAWLLTRAEAARGDG